MEGFYTVKEVCRLLHISRETLRRWERDHWFPEACQLYAAQAGPGRPPKVRGPRMD